MFVVTQATRAATGRVVNVASVRVARGVRPVQQHGHGRRHGGPGAAARDRVPSPHRAVTGVAPAGPLQGRRAVLAAGPCWESHLRRPARPRGSRPPSRGDGRVADLRRGRPPFPPEHAPRSACSPRPRSSAGDRTATACPSPRRSPSGASGSSPGTRPRGCAPAAPAGVVRLTAHTYPRHRPGPPGPRRRHLLGNLLLARLRTGARLEVAGPRANGSATASPGAQVRAAASLSGYYDTTGAPRLAILVCSGETARPGRLDPPHHLVGAPRGGATRRDQSATRRAPGRPRPPRCSAAARR